MPLKLELNKTSTADCATAVLTLPEIPDFPLTLNLVNLTLDSKSSCSCMVVVDLNGELIEHIVHQRRHVEDCRYVLSRIELAPSALFIDRVLKPVVEELNDRLQLSIALPIPLQDPLSHMKALANGAAVGLLSYKQLESNLGPMNTLGFLISNPK